MQGKTPTSQPEMSVRIGLRLRVLRMSLTIDWINLFETVEQVEADVPVGKNTALFDISCFEAVRTRIKILLIFECETGLGTSDSVDAVVIGRREG